MDQQATLNGRPGSDPSAHALTQSLASIAQGMVKIAELQMQLLAVDLQALRSGALRGLLMWLIASGLLVALLPTALIGAGFWLAEVAHVSTSAGLLWVASIALLLVVGLLIAGWRQFNGHGASLQRSTKELQASLTAIRHLLSSSTQGASED